MNIDTADPDLQKLRVQATALAGATGDLVQRASVYHHLYADSGGNHSFPLLAAHGALWASGYFRAGMRFGSLISRGRALLGDDADLLMSKLRCFAEDFRDINRRVCVETVFIYRLTADPALAAIAESVVPPALLAEMDRCHHARRAGRSLTVSERRDLFTAFFLWEQANIVGPAIKQAFAAFDWPLIKSMARRPKIRFSYFGRTPLSFRDFINSDERIEKGIAAFDRACWRGWGEVERALTDYSIMPHRFGADPNGFFLAVQRTIDERLNPLTT